MTYSVGAFFQCYKNPFATFNVLLNYRKSYPEETIILVSDNGYNYEKMALYFNAIYFHENENCLTQKDYNIIEMKIFINRYKRLLPLIKENYFMLLEDDVIVNKPYTEPFNGTINGNCINYISKKTFESLLCYNGPCIDRVYTGHGGSIFNKEEFLKLLNNDEIIDCILNNWKNQFLGPYINGDIFFCILAYVSGYTIHKLSQHKDGMIYLNTANVVHQYKIYYNIKLPDKLQYLVREN